MKEQIKNWIKENYPTKESAYRKCQEATLKLVKEFPFLSRKRGYVLTEARTVPHWWCEMDDEIFDPTQAQFKDIFEYQELEKEPVGKCMCCGEISFFEKEYCSVACLDESGRYYNKK